MSQAFRRLIVNDEAKGLERYGLSAITDLEPGEYVGPITGYTGDVPAVFYCLPNGSWGHVCTPPHTFRECDDSSLEIRESILHHAGSAMAWHGYLDEGYVWREC